MIKQVNEDGSITYIKDKCCNEGYKSITLSPLKAEEVVIEITPTDEVEVESEELDFMTSEEENN